MPVALARGNSLRRPTCVHDVAEPLDWLAHERSRGARVLGVEIADEAVRLVELPLADRRMVVSSATSRPASRPRLSTCSTGAVEIPMIGTCSSFNVAVAGSLVLYELAGMS